jgi:hypothetical protein
MTPVIFHAMCAALFAQYEPLIQIFSGALAGAGTLAGVVMGLIRAFSH